MKQPKQRSLAQNVGRLLIAMAISVSALFALDSIYALRALREQVYETNRSTLSMYTTNMEDSFQNVERFLSGFGYNEVDIPMLNAEDELQRYLALSREQIKLDESLPSNSGVDGFFIYNASYDLFAMSSQSWVGNSEFIQMRERLRQDLGTEAVYLSRWFSYQIGHNYYLMRIVRIQGSYVGAWVNVENLLEPLYQTPLGQDGMIYIYDKETPLSAQLPQDLQFDPSTAEQHYQMIGESYQRFLVVSWPTVSEELYVVALISDSSIRHGMRSVYRMTILVVVFLAVAMFGISVAMRQLFVYPMQRLTRAIRQVRDGNLGTQVDEQALSREFSEVTHSFNEMSAEIKTLKISVYEQKLQQQHIYLEYLKQQITPHFYINCLNTIYSMAGLGKNDLVRRLSRELSQHLRYTMNSQTTVELGKEIEHVRNYLSLTEIRYPGTLTCTIDVDPALDKALVPPLLLQSFVENTVKHEVVMGEPMQIYLTIQEYWAGSSRKIHINIWDTGRGYQPELLERINAEADSRSDEIALGDGTHIGISNTIQRLRILFGDAVQIHFSNHTDAGAQCDINIPFTMTQQPTVSEEG